MRVRKTELIIPGVQFSFGVSAVHTLLKGNFLDRGFGRINDASIYGALYNGARFSFPAILVAGFDDADESSINQSLIRSLSIYREISAMTMALDFVKGKGAG